MVILVDCSLASANAHCMRTSHHKREKKPHGVKPASSVLTVCGPLVCQRVQCGAQANSLEFEPALAWRRLHEAVRAAKRALRDEHADQLAQLMQLYLQVRLPDLSFPAH